ncbi:hypothetical protein [Mucilaginibacter myungsuensis]|uniref:Uncharacterized protein n=1 Tax=Mucilaginibacter myungsuensis TaxID=649104 RepID=A0A929KUJ9_9SPHI|nr:hypothetical protein [Mucilaginibacter myungsuensis]MBE9661452.1 hypothetical protein [Mucilaginibacter myungsuensis]MDN3597595.1 hypothetical protein [Mucilaginibacter myungsuensis]
MNLKSLLIPAIALTTQIATAQKLPSVQKESVYAPANVKIDGKPNEWNGKFQAKNDATLLTYVMSNDEENLYLTLQADHKIPLYKIFFDGISLTIKSNKNTKLTPLKLTYPLIVRADRKNIVTPLLNKLASNDSVATVVNTALGQSAKTIALRGFKDIADPDVSVYNDLGVKAAAQVDNIRLLTIEYCLPLKYIRHLSDENSGFDYEITVIGNESLVAARAAEAANGNSAPVTISNNGGIREVVTTGGPGPEYVNPTYLRTTYKLAKKP